MRHHPDPFDTPDEATYANREITRLADAREDAATDAAYDHDMPTHGGWDLAGAIQRLAAELNDRRNP